ncbi:MAG: GntR family transcriptional regulator [Microbacteriaceae bacterium]|nr:GntR family transcriptional regulator [Microbacteriaceae bacterium]
MTGDSSVTKRVYSLLLDEIVTGQMPSGSLHSIYQVAERLGVSRTPAREAVLRLADARMITIEANRGFRVVAIDWHEIRDIFDARLLLEVPAAGNAALVGGAQLCQQLDVIIDALGVAAGANDLHEFTQRDRELHRAIILSGGNERIASIVDALRDATQAIGASTINRSRTTEEVRFEHVPIVEAIRSGDPVAATHHMRNHLITTARLLISQIANSEDAAGSWPESWTDTIVEPPQ